MSSKNMEWQFSVTQIVFVSKLCMANIWPENPGRIQLFYAMSWQYLQYILLSEIFKKKLLRIHLAVCRLIMHIIYHLACIFFISRFFVSKSSIHNSVVANNLSFQFLNHFLNFILLLQLSNSTKNKYISQPYPGNKKTKIPSMASNTL